MNDFDPETPQDYTPQGGWFFILCGLFWLFVTGIAHSDPVGLAELRQIAPQLNGAGTSVGQVEASVSSSVYQFEPNSNLAPGASFNYTDAYGNSSGTYDSTLGSWHANEVGGILYGPQGVAPGVSNVDVFAENYFSFAFPIQQTPSVGSTVPSVVNQSFIYVGASAANIQYFDTQWDNIAAYTNVLYITAIGDGQTTGTTPPSYINPPADMYNGIAVGAYTGTETNGVFSPSTGSEATWVGPTWDGRSKPDITAPGAYTSYTAPVVSGVAVLMEQAARGTNLPGPVGFNSSDPAVSALGTPAYTRAATDIRTVKALLFNGAVKPVGWTNSYAVTNGVYTYNAPTVRATVPFDPRYGSGVVNAYNSYENLAGGEHPYTAATLPNVGWNLTSITTAAPNYGLETYQLNVARPSDLTATLTWNKDYNTTAINHLLLFLLTPAGQQVAESASMVDNVQQINVNPALGISPLVPGQYDLAVEILGGTNAISTSETYALAWNLSVASVPETRTLSLLALGCLFFAWRKGCAA